MRTSTSTATTSTITTTRARKKREAQTGPVRSLRLPAALNTWFEERLAAWHDLPSALLVALVHGGLRLREGYMPIHRRTLEGLVRDGDATELDVYVTCLRDTFGDAYVSHLERWLAADGVAQAVTRPDRPASGDGSGCA